MTKKTVGVLLFCVCLPLFFLSGTRTEAESDDTDGKVTFIELGSVNCIPCRMMQPVMEQVEENFPNDVAVIFYDVWRKEEKKYAKEYNIRVIPTQIFLDKNGEEYFRHEGFFPYEEVVKILQQKGVDD